MAAVLESTGGAEAVAQNGERRSGLRLSHLGLWSSLLAVLAGFALPLNAYLSPRFGIGYGLGIAGGLMMLGTLIYPVRKRKPSLAVIGSVRFWFRAHMVFGIVGPIAVLYHSNFSLGATNSNVALACMLLVAGSGLVGRYLYARIHYGLYGRRATLRELSGDAENLRQHTGALRLLPGLIAAVEAAEQHIARPAPLFIRPMLAAVRQRRELRRLSKAVNGAIAMAATRSRVVRWQRQRFTQTTIAYVAARLVAARRVAEFEASERLFATWHVLHVPLLVMLVIVGIIHVVAVHVY
jgi:hypothetical protein